MTSYEQKEILDYQMIYYLGTDVERKSLEHEFDDERGDYRIITWDHIAYRFEIIEIIGKGSFGQCLKVLDHKRKQEMALKIIRN